MKAFNKINKNEVELVIWDGIAEHVPEGTPKYEVSGRFLVIDGKRILPGACYILNDDKFRIYYSVKAARKYYMFADEKEYLEMKAAAKKEEA